MAVFIDRVPKAGGCSYQNRFQGGIQCVGAWDGDGQKEAGKRQGRERESQNEESCDEPELKLN